MFKYVKPHIYLGDRVSKNITLSLPDDVFVEMRDFPEIKWSEVARKAIVEKLELLKELDSIASKSKLSEKDAAELGEKIKKGIAKRHGFVD